MHWSGKWCGWLKGELDKLGIDNFFETFPDSIMARSEYWLPFLKNHVKAGENDIIVGWSSGAVAAMRYAEDVKIKGSILISPSHTDLSDPLEKQSGYFDRSWRWDAIRNNQEKITLVYGDDDLYIPQEQFEYIADQLRAEPVKIHNGGHFLEQTTFPELLEKIKIM